MHSNAIGRPKPNKLKIFTVYSLHDIKLHRKLSKKMFSLLQIFFDCSQAHFFLGRFSTFIFSSTFIISIHILSAIFLFGIHALNFKFVLFLSTPIMLANIFILYSHSIYTYYNPYCSIAFTT